MTRNYPYRFRSVLRIRVAAARGLVALRLASVLALALSALLVPGAVYGAPLRNGVSFPNGAPLGNSAPLELGQAPSGKTWLANAPLAPAAALAATTPLDDVGWASDESAATASVAWGDWDGDGDLDLAVGNYGQANQVYENVGGTLSLAWESTGVLSSTTSVAWGDYDGDGDLDLAVGNGNQANQVYENAGGTLSLSPASGLGWESTGDTKWTESVAWGDWDGDGDLDLAVGNYWDVNQVYENAGGTLGGVPA
ncbi:MAG: FG-GAP-like repeat-containing protein, partial [Anaerolineae bacterium]